MSEIYEGLCGRASSDDFAIRKMLERNISPLYLPLMLERISKTEDADKTGKGNNLQPMGWISAILETYSTHQSMEERIEYIQEKIKQH